MKFSDIGMTIGTKAPEGEVAAEVGIDLAVTGAVEGKGTIVIEAEVAV